MRARAGIHGIQIVHQRFHRLIGGAVGFLYGLFVRERLHARNIRFAHAQLRQLFALPGDEFVVLHQRGARRAGQDHIQRKIGADVRARVVHAAKQFQRAHHVIRVALHKGLAHAFGHGIIEVHDALPAVLVVLVGLDGDAGERGIAVDVPRFAQIALSCGETVFEQAEQIDLAAGRGEGEEIHIVDVDIAIAVRLGVFGLDHAQKVELFRAFGAVLQHGAHGGIAIDIGVFALEVGIFGGTESNILINLHQPSVDFAHAAALGAIENIAFGGAHKAVFNEDFFNRVLHLFNCGHFDGFAFFQFCDDLVREPFRRLFRFGAAAGVESF